eukprot:evm.model.scf_781EXC.3 EVM.evm.TU.scf_781EXC.3   scf_781EXC:43318-51771(-)
MYSRTHDRRPSSALITNDPPGETPAIMHPHDHCALSHRTTRTYTQTRDQPVAATHTGSVPSGAPSLPPPDPAGLSHPAQLGGIEMRHGQTRASAWRSSGREPWGSIGAIVAGLAGPDRWPKLSGLYLGSIESLDSHVLKERKITHVLTVMNYLVDKLDPKITHKHIYVPDDFTGNLLIHFSICMEFIRVALADGGRVLVHCFAGISRSSTIVTAYIMTTQKLTYTAAIHKLRQKYPIARPNPNFVEQLRMFRSMGYRIDPYDSNYKMFKLKLANNQYKFGWSTVNEMQFADLPNGTEDGDHSFQGDNLYQCRACSRLLATSLHIVSATKEGEAAVLQAMGDDGSLFIEPMRWMTGVTDGVVQGKLYCPQCEAKLGAFNWAGMQDEKENWYVPAFKLRLKKLDVVRPDAPTRLPTPRLSMPKFSTPKISTPKLLPKAQGGAAVAPDVQPPPPEAPGAGLLCPPALDYLVLDCDGVMVDSEAASCESLRLCILSATGLDIPHAFPQDYYDVFGMDVRSCVEHYAKKFDRTDWDIDEVAKQAAAEKETIYRRLTANGIKAFPGVVSLVEMAKKRGVPVGVGSSGAPEKIQHNLRSAKLENLIPEDKIVSAHLVARGKPAPDVYIEVLKRLGCSDPSKAVIVEDAIHGLHAAKGAGAFAVGITTSLPRERLEPHADMVVDSLVELKIFFAGKDVKAL